MNDNERPWQVLRRETVYESEWVRLHRDDVRLPDGEVIAGYHVIGYPLPAVCVVPVGDDGRVLLNEQYRFITDTLGWEVAAGRMEDGETPQQTAARELREETGYTAEQLEYLGFYHPSNGSSDQTFHVFIGRGVRYAGALLTPNEVQRVAWFSAGEIWGFIARNEIHDGFSLTALLWYIGRLRTDERRVTSDDRKS